MAASNQYLQRYNAIRNSLAAGEADPQRRQIALNRFDSDPRAQRLRQLAGLAPLSTKQGDVQQAAKQSVQQRVASAGSDLGKDATIPQSASAGIARGMFGIPEVLAAAGERLLPSALTGNNTNASFSNILQMIRAKDTAAIAANPKSGLIGELGGGIVGGGAAGKAVMSGAGKVASLGVPAVSKIAKVVQAIGTLKKGQTLTNAGKLAAIGTAGGAAQAAGTGEDVATGAAEGAVAAPLVAGAASSIGKFLLRPAADVLGLSNAGSYLKRFTNATTDEIQQRLADFRAKTGAEPTLLELLPLADRNHLIQNTVAGRDPAVEQASNAIRARTANVQPEMQDVVQGATQGERLKTQRAMVQSLTEANGGTPVPGDNVLALQASQSPTDMLRLRRVESQRIMAPHDNAKVVDNFSDLIPQHPQSDTSADQTIPLTGADGTPLVDAQGNPITKTVPGKTSISMIESDPEASRAIRSVSGGLQARKPGEGVTVQEITNMISDLREDAAQGGIEGRAADRAAQHLMDTIQSRVPEAAAATEQMRSAYAAHSRMAEGMGEGWQQRLRDEIQVGTSNSRAQGVQNAYDTDEGTAGRQLGTTNRLMSDLSGTPQSAASTTIDLARNGNPAIAENLGQDAGDKIQTAATAQGQSLEALASAGRSAQSGDGTQLNPNDITTALLAMGPHPFAKAKILSKLASFSVLPPGKAKVVVDMLLSQDPRLTARAVQALGNERGGADILKQIAGLTGQQAVDANAPGPPADPAASAPATPAASPAPDPYEGVGVPVSAQTDATPPPSAGEDPYAAVGKLADPNAKVSPYASTLTNIYTQENPDVVSLVQRVKDQESRGNQAAVSKKGAIGRMQVMPDTAPEAAKLAGVPWDPKAYKEDGTYNEILGHAYLSSLLKKYNGDVNQSLAAYNAGPGRVDAAVAANGDNWLTAVPAETQDYVAKVGG